MKVCERFGVKLVSKEATQHMLIRLKIDNHTFEQKKDSQKKAIKEHHDILLICGADNYKYGELVKK